MGKTTIELTEQLYDYLLDVSLRDNALLRALRKHTDEMESGAMQISADQGQFMALQLKLMQAKRVIEIGTFTGYSALVMALALPSDGRLVACDTNEEWTAIAQRYWDQAGITHKINLQLGPALKTLQKLLEKGEEEQFDAAFIDADKVNLRNYYEKCLQLVRPGGLIMIDNVLWGGEVIDTSNQSADTRAIRELNTYIYNDERVDISLVPIGDGLTLARKHGVT
jgi:caffeoyl-CoA O-methyltransferase